MRAVCVAALGFAVTLGALSGVVASIGATPAFAQAAPADAAKPVALTQANIDGAIAAQKDIRAFQAKQPPKADDKPDPKADAQIETIVKKHGFTDGDQYAGVSDTIAGVMAGIDPDTKAYVGPQVVIKKQIADIQADKKMSAKDKKEAVDELNAALGSAPADKPSQANIDLVSKNYDALSQSMDGE